MRKIAKRVISLLCVMSMLFSVIITSSAQEAETAISVESQTVEQGIGTENIEVPIRISNNTGILGMTVSVTFDEDLTLVNAVQGDVLSSLTFTTSKEYTDTPYNLVWDGESRADTGNGVIAVLTFAVPKETEKDYAINITTNGVFDGNVKPFNPTAVSGKISVVGNQQLPSSETAISVESQTIEQGTGTENVQVPIKVTNNTGILGMTVSVTFDEDLTLVNAVQGDVLSSLTFTTSKEYTDIPYNLVWDGESRADTGNGVIAVLTFAVPKETEKDYAINITTSGVFDGNVKPFNPTAVSGKITVNKTSSSDDTILDSGTDANGIQWTLYKTGILNISGNGAMSDYSKTSEIPWYSNRLSVTEVIIDENITHLAARAFYGCIYLTKITIPKSVNSIGTYTFRNCDEMTIYGEVGSFAEEYAIENEIPFVNTKVEVLKDMTLEYAATSKKMYFDILVEDYSEDATVYVAIYDVNGKMIDVTSETLFLDDITSLSLNKNTNASYAKVFVWTNELKPVTKTELVSDL